MSASAISMHEWVNTFRDSVSAQIQIHPSAQGICREYLNAMHSAVEAADMDELARLCALTQDKILDELHWEEQKRRSADDPHHVVRHERCDVGVPEYERARREEAKRLDAVRRTAERNE
jgi:hypothetical protein